MIVDLGGMNADAAPNPNVMYELGSTCFWPTVGDDGMGGGQDLPFDVSNQARDNESLGTSSLRT